MEISMFQQTSAFLWAFVLGTVIALSYTVFVSVRDVFSCSNVGVFISDAVFSFFVSVIHFLYAVAMTDQVVVTKHIILVMLIVDFLVHITDIVTNIGLKLTMVQLKIIIAT